MQAYQAEQIKKGKFFLLRISPFKFIIHLQFLLYIL